jgi:putative membrane protein
MQVQTRVIGIAALAGLVLTAACADKTTTQDTTAAAAATPAAATPAPALDDPTIVAIFDAANTADIETGQLAAQKGSTKEVRDFGAQLVTQHTAVRKEGRDLAAKLGVTPTPPADSSSAKAHADAMALLRGKSGVEFDKAFLEHEVRYHQAVINAVNTTLLPALKNAEVKALVVKVAPAFEAHRAMAANMRQKLGA